MKSKHWPVVIGASLLSFTAGFLAKKTQKSDSKEWVNQYVGQWHYTSGHKHQQHHVKITREFKLFLDGHEVKGSLKEMSNKNLVWQDEFGYHVKIITNGQEPVELYDEADDKTYVLEKK